MRTGIAGATVAALLLIIAPSATAGGSLTPATYGPARDWGGTQIRSLDPAPQLPAPLPVGAASAGSPPPGTAGGSSNDASAPQRVIPPDQILSDEVTFTQWAYVHRIANIYRTPSTTGRAIKRLHWYTEDGFPEIYLLLRAHWDSAGREWVKLRIPARPNGQTGWVLRNALGAFHMTHAALVVNRETMRISYYSNGRRIWSAPVGVGEPSMPTPTGHFWIRERFVLTNPSNGYYPYAFGTADYSTLSDWPGGGVVGIHGPYGAPASAIPGRISHGCIRLRIPDDFWLGRHLQLGTPLRVV
jgi:hypothetical protein